MGATGGSNGLRNLRRGSVATPTQRGLK
jgi:hypothetical protein